MTARRDRSWYEAIREYNAGIHRLWGRTTHRYCDHTCNLCGVQVPPELELCPTCTALIEKVDRNVPNAH